MTANGTHPTPPSIFRDPADSPDQQYLPDCWAPLLADERWLNEQYNLGAFEAYRGEFIAVVDRTLLGHHPSLRALREQVSRETGHPIGRIVTSYVDAYLDKFPE